MRNFVGLLYQKSRVFSRLSSNYRPGSNYYAIKTQNYNLLPNRSFSSSATLSRLGSEPPIMRSKVTNYLILLGVDFGIQFVGWAASSLLQSEKFYDLAGSATFITAISLSLAWSRQYPRQIVQSNLIILWALRLGLFLFVRVIKSGGDRRFDEAKKSPAVLFVYWFLQGIWVAITLLPSVLLNSAGSKAMGAPSVRDYIGWGIWLFGFSFETIADFQKTLFKNDPENAGKFINTGLWSISRHPNYFGEILLWFGLYISASSSFISYEYISVISPIFIFILISKVSGVPLLEKSGMEKWGHLEEYQEYLKKIPVLIPFLNCKVC